jgi:hypothetical protein
MEKIYIIRGNSLGKIQEGRGEKMKNRNRDAIPKKRGS